MATLATYVGSEALRQAPDVFALYDEVFGDVPDYDSWRESVFDRHCGRKGFRLVTARDGERLVGFGWGYVGSRGEYWPDLVVEALPAEVTDEWVGGHFEMVELAVSPDARRQGLGERLHDALLEGVAPRRALLGTDDADTPATRLYVRKGWRRLGELSPGVQVMGLRLRR